MQGITTVAELCRWRAGATPAVGFVPTMGYLHDGHLSLVRRARSENATVLASIFVNPTQFGPQEDFQRYPRDLERDLALLKAERVDAVFTPEVEEMYPPGASTTVDVEALTGILEGASRPGHFRGVATIVCKLFHLVRPDQAYFGEKDYQQLQVIRRMVHDLRMPVKVVGCPTIREPDGLAMSSRNVYLQSTERQAAVVLSQALSRAIQLHEGGVQESVHLQMEVQKMLDQHPLIRTDYVAVVHPQTLQPVVSVATAGAVICLAVWIGQTRLIDNARIFAGDG